MKSIPKSSNKFIKELFWLVYHQDQDNLEELMDTFLKEKNLTSIKKKSKRKDKKFKDYFHFKIDFYFVKTKEYLIF